MKPEEKERFVDLARRSHAGRASKAEREELSGMLQHEEGLKAEYKRLGKDLNVAKEILPLLKASEAPPQRVPQYARARLHTKVREVLLEKKAGSQERRGLVDVILAWAQGAETDEARQRRLALISEIPERLFQLPEREVLFEEPQLLYLRASAALKREVPDAAQEIRFLIDRLRNLQAEMKNTREAFTNEIGSLAEQMYRKQQEMEARLAALERQSSETEEKLLKLIEALRK